MHRKIKQYSISKASDDAADPQANQQGADTVSEMHATENGMVVEGEQEFFCNGETSETTPLVKQEQEENYENSLEGLQKMLGYNISEEVEKQKEETGNKKKKKFLSESSDADGKISAGNSILTSLWRVRVMQTNITETDNNNG